MGLKEPDLSKKKKKRNKKKRRRDKKEWKKNPSTLNAWDKH